MELLIGDLDFLCMVAQAEEQALRDELTEIQLRISELPPQVQIIEFGDKIEKIKQKLKSAEIKTLNLLCEIEFANSRKDGEGAYGPLLNSLIENEN